MFFQMNGVASDNFVASNATVSSTKCTGSDDFKSVFFAIDNMWLEVRPEDYMTHDKATTTCKFAFKGIDAPFNIIGLPIYMDYYVSHFWNECEEGSNCSTMAFNSNGRGIKEAPTKLENFSTNNILKN